MKRWLVSFALVLSVTATLILWWNRPSARLRRQVNFWAHGSAWSDPNLNCFEAEARQAEGLQSLGPKIIPLLLDDLERGDSRLDNLLLRGPPGLQKMATGGLAASFRHRREAARALVLLGVESKPYVTRLLHQFGGNDDQTLPFVAELLGVIGENKPEITTMLEKFARGTYPPMEEARTLAAISLARLQPANGNALHLANRWLAELDQFDPVSPWEPALALARMGRAALPFAPGLQGVLDRRESMRPSLSLVRQRYAACALWKMKGTPEDALAFLSLLQREWLSRKSARVEVEICQLARELAEIPEFSARARPTLEAMGERKEPEFDALRADALRRVKAAAARP